MSSYGWRALEAAVDDIERRPSPPRPRRLGSARAGVLAGAVLLGMQDVLEPPRDRVPMEAPAAPAGGRGWVRVQLDPCPCRSIAVVGVTPSS